VYLAFTHVVPAVSSLALCLQFEGARKWLVIMSMHARTIFVATVLKTVTSSLSRFGLINLLVVWIAGLGA